MVRVRKRQSRIGKVFSDKLELYARSVNVRQVKRLRRYDQDRGKQYAEHTATSVFVLKSVAIVGIEICLQENEKS
jgi:hypothetical protein